MSRCQVLGSIGVLTEVPNVYERLKKEGVEFSTVTAGKYKRRLTPTKKLDAADVAKTKEGRRDQTGAVSEPPGGAPAGLAAALLSRCLLQHKGTSQACPLLF